MIGEVSLQLVGTAWTIPAQASDATAIGLLAF